MFREKEICNAIRTAYLHLFPDKKERKRALSRLDLELVAQGVRYRGESVLAYDDLFQIGCLGLCKAAQTDKPGHTVAFSTYAYRLIRNEIYTELERATRRGREVATDPAELPCTVLDDNTPEQREACMSLQERGGMGAVQNKSNLSAAVIDRGRIARPQIDRLVQKNWYQN